jgi:hypothetical protein
MNISAASSSSAPPMISAISTISAGDMCYAETLFIGAENTSQCHRLLFDGTRRHAAFAGMGGCLPDMNEPLSEKI